MTEDAGVASQPNPSVMPIALQVEVAALTPCKQCSTCMFVKPLSDFVPENGDECTDCAGHRGTKRPRDDDTPSPPSLKVCSKCQQPKPKSDYYRNMARPDNLHPMCKSCHTAAVAARRMAKGAKPGRQPSSPQRRSTRERKQPTWARNMVLGDTPLSDSESTDSDDLMDVSDADALLAHAALHALQQSMMQTAKWARIDKAAGEVGTGVGQPGIAVGGSEAAAPWPTAASLPVAVPVPIAVPVPVAAAPPVPVAVPATAPVPTAASLPGAEAQPPSKVPSTKRCRSCGEELPWTLFYTTKAETGQLSTNCKPCTSRINKERSMIRQTMGVDIPPTKTCRGCQLEKPADAFYRNKGAPDGLFARCKDCTTEKRHRNMVEEPTVTHKVCRRCKIDKPATDFARNRSIKDGLYSWCRACDALKAQGRQNTRGMGPTVATKECGQCRLELASCRFYRDPNTVDGLSKRCKKCTGGGTQAAGGPSLEERVSAGSSPPTTLLLGTAQPHYQQAAAMHATAGTAAANQFVEVAMRVLAATSQAPAAPTHAPAAPTHAPAAPRHTTSAFPSLNLLMGVPTLQNAPTPVATEEPFYAEVLPLDVEVKLLPPE